MFYLYCVRINSLNSLLDLGYSILDGSCYSLDCPILRSSCPVFSGFSKAGLSVRLGNALNLVFLLEGVAVRRGLGAIDQFIG
jgi:hypothetical protein